MEACRRLLAWVVYGAWYGIPHARRGSIAVVDYSQLLLLQAAAVVAETEIMDAPRVTVARARSMQVMIVFMVWCSLTVASVASMRRHDRQSHGRGENRQGEEGSCEDLGHLCHSQALSLQACAGRTVIGLIDEKASIAARRKRIMAELLTGNCRRCKRHAPAMWSRRSSARMPREAPRQGSRFSWWSPAGSLNDGQTARFIRAALFPG